MLDQYYLKGAELRDLTRTSSAFNVVAYRPGRPTFMLHAANMRHGEDTRRAQLRLHEVNCLSPLARPAFPDRSTFETNTSDALSDRDRSFFRAWFARIARQRTKPICIRRGDLLSAELDSIVASSSLRPLLWAEAFNTLARRGPNSHVLACLFILLKSRPRGEQQLGTNTTQSYRQGFLHIRTYVATTLNPLIVKGFTQKDAAL